MIITLDGPCGSGKSTLAQLLAHKLGFFYINSGYLYRAVAFVLREHFGYDEQKFLQLNLEDVAFILDEHRFVYEYKDGAAHVFFSGYEITDRLKEEIISYYASIISAYPMVRQLIVPVQQKFAHRYNLVTDGRDCGTEIYPQADFKFYVTALPEVRAQRLINDAKQHGNSIEYDQALHMIMSRDHRDMTRIISPLRKAADAVEIDTSNQSIHATLEKLVSIIEQRKRCD